jgi:F0F1-type ATP synthase assembly protein I
MKQYVSPLYLLKELRYSILVGLGFYACLRLFSNVKFSPLVTLILGICIGIIVELGRLILADLRGKKW